VLSDDEDMEDIASNRLGFSSGKAVAGGFALRYDTQTPLRAIDVGGPDQEMKYVSLNSARR